MRHKYLVIPSMFILFSTSISQAADVINETPEAPVYEETFSWSGAYIGAQAGYTFGRNKLSISNSNDFSINSNGFAGGAYAGYNWLLTNSYLLGIEGDINFSNINKDTQIVSRNNVSLDWNAKTQFEGAVRARVGYAYDRWLPYLAGGVAFARVKDVFSVNVAGNTVETIDIATNRVGFTVGAGLDYAITDNVILRYEYRYSDYGTKKEDAEDNKIERKYSSNNLRLGLAYKF